MMPAGEERGSEKSTTVLKDPHDFAPCEAPSFSRKGIRMNRTTLFRLGLPVTAALLAPVAAGAPAFAAALPAPTATEVGTTATVGQPVKFKFAEPDGSKPAEYHWLVNSGELSGTTTAVDGKATAKVLATTGLNRLEVYAVDADGSVSSTTTVFYSATFPSTSAADQDLDGDGKPDLVAAVGDALLVAGGKGTGGKVKVPAVNLGSDNGVGGTFAGRQVITGKFAGGPFEDYLAYNPAGGGAPAFTGLGAADLTHPQLIPRDEHSVDLSDWDGNYPIQLANAYNGSGSGNAVNDLVGILGDAASGYHLQYYPSLPFGYGWDLPVDTGAATPDGSGWQNWKLASKLLPGGTALTLWNPSTGALYLWEGVRFDGAALSYTQYKLSADFLTGATGTTLRLTDFDADGVPDIWGISADGTVTAYVISGLSETGTATIKAKAPQPLV
jgi:hypothetical protein